MLIGNTTRRVAIVGGARIPFARSHGAYANADNGALLAASLRALVERYQLSGVRLGDVIAGATLKHSKDFNLVREAVQSVGLHAETPGLDIQRACGTSLEAAVLIANKIALGQIDCGIAAGVEATSDPPVVYAAEFRQLLLESYRGRSFGARLRPWLRLRPRMFKPVLPAVVEPRTGLSMGQSCELMAKTWGITREQQDRAAFESHRKAAAAWKEGFFDDLVVPYGGLGRDNNVRADVSLEKLGALRAAFAADGTLTAGNSTPLTDGSAALLLASEEWARARGLPVIAWMRAGKTWAVDYASGHEGLLMAPAYAVAAMLKDTGLKLQDFDYYEIHEAFAAVMLCLLSAWESPTFCQQRLGWDGALGRIDPAKLNVKGGSVAIGHPFAATGARILAVLAKLLASTPTAQRGLATACTAGGMGVAAILERA